jgi:hypothetical protein
LLTEIIGKFNDWPSGEYILYMPGVRRSALKHYWTELELDELEECSPSKETFNL